MNILVTGGAGFIGSNFVRWWARERPGDTRRRVRRADLRRQPRQPRRRAARVRARRHRRHRRARCRRCATTRSTSIVNFAAESHNSYAITNPGVFFRRTSSARRRLCEAVRRVGVEKFHRFHHVSTCEVYGDLALDATEPFNESSPYAPRTPYNASKAGGDHAVRAYYETFDLPISITNCANNYGPYQFPEKVIPLFTTRRHRRPRHPAVRVDAEPAGMDPRRRPLPRDRDASSTTAASARHTTSVPARSAASRRSPTACSPRSGSPRR